MDPVGVVVDKGDFLLRGIRPNFAAYYTSLLQRPSVSQLIGNKVIDTTIDSSQGMDGFPLVLRHRKISPLNYCYEWTPLMLQDAAILHLDMCMELLEDELTLKDATPWNVLYDGATPRFVDFTSIMPQEKDLLWVAYDQFCRFFLFPLLVAKETSGKISRSLLLSSLSGINDIDLVQLIPGNTWMRHGWLLKRLYIPRFFVNLIRKSGQDRRLVEANANITHSPQARLKFFRDLSDDVQSMSFSPGKSRWSQYYEDIQHFIDLVNLNAKQRAIMQLLDTYKPGQVVDIGCNLGGYSILAAKAGARVVAFDTDEDSVAMLYQIASKNHFSILPLVMDVLNPTPSCGWRAIQYPAAPLRFQSEMAFALALVHHLAITQIQTFERIVKTLKDYTSRWLITEFVPLDDPRSQELLLTNRRDMGWYSLDNFLNALKAEFSKVETQPSYPEGRTLCICEV